MGISSLLPPTILVLFAVLHTSLGQLPVQPKPITILKPVETNVLNIRRELLYPIYHDDWQELFNHETRRIHKQFKFHLPFFGFYFNYTWVSLHGNIAFSDGPPLVEYPIKLPSDKWPIEKDPSFIGPFYAPSLPGYDDNADEEKKLPSGIYYRVVSVAETMAQEDHDIQEAVRRDLHEGMIGTTDFFPKHIILITWKNVTFEGSPNKFLTNTYQMMLTTDEYRTYCIFNYRNIKWVAITAADGSNTGQGGKAAFVGFNAGNGTRAFEYHPYSQRNKLYDLMQYGTVNGKPGRHAFRIDEQIVQGSCNYEPNINPQLVMSPESGHMLGGTVVNISGPCFKENQKISLKFHDKEVTCAYRSRNIATCVTPRIYTAGYVEVSSQLESGAYHFRNKFYIENPMIATEVVWFDQRALLNRLDIRGFTVNWIPSNISYDNPEVTIGLYGYREYAMKPELELIRVLGTTRNWDGKLTIDTSTLPTNDAANLLDFRFGLIQVSGYAHGGNDALQVIAQLWSRPIPLGWYFKEQWKYHYGENWAEKFCQQWELDDARLKNFAHEIPRCPCTLGQALVDKGRFAPDFGCDKWGNRECYGSEKILHCVRSGQPSKGGGGQQCCYGHDENLVMNVDMKEGGIPSRSHPFGVYPYDDSTKVPGLSHWFHDWSAYFSCCEWQPEMSEGCYQFKWRRASQDCIGYQPPNASLVFGDPHIVTFDNLQYTFNGQGEFTLLNVHHQAHFLEVQARFEQYVDQQHKRKLPATILTAMAMTDNVSSTVEIQLRPLEARWRYRMNVLVDEKYVYFDRPAQRLQSFRGVTVYTPSDIRNQSQVITMFQSGAGIEVIETNGYIAARVYLPKSFMNTTKGLMGNWSNNIEDDLAPPGQDVYPLAPGTALEQIHKNFGLEWAVTDEGSQQIAGKRSHFYHENGRSSSYYFNKTFVANWEKYPKRPTNSIFTEVDIDSLCGGVQTETYQCRYDLIVTQNKELAAATKLSLVTFTAMKSNDLKTIITCGALATPMHGRKSTNKYVVNTEVKFECEQGYVLEGEPVRWCYDYGIWSWTEYGKTRCTLESTYYAKKAGITSGIVLGLLIPCIIAGICLFGFILGRSVNTYRRTPPVWADRKQNQNPNKNQHVEMETMEEKRLRKETEA